MHGGDPTRHLGPAELDLRLGQRPSAPRDHGTVRLLVARLPGDARELPTAVDLAPDRPVPGDRWEAERDPERKSQITAMAWDVANALANGQSLALFGDNLLLDLALDQLPPGSVLRVGEAVLEVTPEPHTGCKKFAARFGVAALAWISVPARKPLHLRGVHLRVLAPGRVAVGDPVVVTRRPDGAPTGS